jgi:hypothetical protein
LEELRPLLLDLPPPPPRWANPAAKNVNRKMVRVTKGIHRFNLAMGVIVTSYMSYVGLMCVLGLISSLIFHRLP